MPTNENTYNSRVTSEALEKKYRDVFPSQGGAELVDDLYASGVITPVIDFSSVAEGSVLPQNLQTAWDFSTGHNTVLNTNVNIISDSGFWLLNVNLGGSTPSGASGFAAVSITDGLSSKIIWEVNENIGGSYAFFAGVVLTVFVRSGDTVNVASGPDNPVDVSYRQIADVNGNLVNPLGFVFT